MTTVSLTRPVVQNLPDQRSAVDMDLLPPAKWSNAAERVGAHSVAIRQTIHRVSTEDRATVYNNRGTLESLGSMNIPRTPLILQMQSEDHIQPIWKIPDDGNSSDDPNGVLEPLSPRDIPAILEEIGRHLLLLRRMLDFLTGFRAPDFLPRQGDFNPFPWQGNNGIFSGSIIIIRYVPIIDPGDIICTSSVSKYGEFSTANERGPQSSSSSTRVDKVA